MSQAKGFSDKVAFIWNVADLLRGDFKEHEYGQVILPFVVLRRLECALAPTKAAVLARSAAVRGKFDNVEPLLLHESGQRFYNTSPLDLGSIMQDPPNSAANLRTYLAGFSPGALEVLERYGFEDKITRLDSAGLLYRVLGKFAELDLSTSAVSNDAMGYIFEELLRRFSEMSNETAGEHFTPREVIRLMVNVLLAPDSTALAGQKPIRTIYDPACGTGGMLTVAQEHVATMNPNAELVAYGQELNWETWAICRSDLMIKGQDPALITQGNSLIIGDDSHPGDGHAGEHFDYLLANPPFGVDWTKYSEAVRDEHQEKGFDGRYGPGLPRVSDGSMLFLLHMISKFKSATNDPTNPENIQGGSRMGIVLSGTPLFAGNAGGGESEIRRFILENDLLEGIIALPDEMFYNTGINTFIWILTNRRDAGRAGKVVLLDARETFTRMQRSLGEKRKTLSSPQVEDITRVYVDALSGVEGDPRVKVLAREVLGFQRVTIERPLRRRWEITSEVIDIVKSDKTWTSWGLPAKGAEDPSAALLEVEANQSGLLEILEEHRGRAETNEAAFKSRLTSAFKSASIDVPPKVLKKIVVTSSHIDESAAIVTDKGGKALPDSQLRDHENVPLRSRYLSLSEAARAAALRADADAFLHSHVHSWAPDAWVDHAKTKLGYAIPFSRLFHKYQPCRPLDEIDADLMEIELRIRALDESPGGMLAPWQPQTTPAPHWQLQKPKSLFVERRESSKSTDVHLTPSQVYGVLPQSEYMEITGNRVVLNLVGSDDMKHVEPGDFIIHLRSFQGGIEYSSYRGKVSNAYTVFTPSAELEPRFFRWLLKSTWFIQELRATTDQLRDGQSIKFEQFSTIELPVPPIEEQVAISDYFDRCKVESELRKKQVELLTEKGQALITAPVTASSDSTGVPSAGQGAEE